MPKAATSATAMTTPAKPPGRWLRYGPPALEPARKCLEELMDVAAYEPVSPIFRSHWLRGKAEGAAEGAAEGVARAVLVVLAARGIDVSDDARQRIAAGTDLDQLGIWVRRAATASTVHDLFAD